MTRPTGLSFATEAHSAPQGENMNRAIVGSIHTECDLCYHVGLCVFDGETYVCADETDCQERQLAQRDDADTYEPPIGPQMPPDEEYEEWL